MLISREFHHKQPMLFVAVGPVVCLVLYHGVQGRPKKNAIKAVSAFVPLGLRIEQSVIRDKFGLLEPGNDAEILGKPAALAVATAANGGQPAKAVDVPDTLDNQAKTMA